MAKTNLSDSTLINFKMQQNTKKHLLLGTAQWGWNVERRKVFQLLDLWLESGERTIDCATNYPINRKPEDFRAAESLLLEYIQAHGLHGELQVTMKIGSLDNMHTPDIQLSPSFIWMMGNEYLRLSGPNLHGLMLHWDNRSEASEITETLAALVEITGQNGLQPGLSGIKHPEMYAACLERYPDIVFDVQLKHNVFHSDLNRYTPLQGAKTRFFGYGLNAGGIQLEGTYSSQRTFAVRGGDPEAMEQRLKNLRKALPEWNSRRNRPAVENFAQIGLIHALYDERLHGVILGVSDTEQLKAALDFAQAAVAYSYEDVAEALRLPATDN